jgi:hypothetical protein
VKYGDLPAWFRQEVQQNLNAIQAEEERIVAATKKVQRTAFVWATVATVVCGVLTGGNIVVLLVLCPALAGVAAYLLAGTNRSHLVAGPIWGLVASAACFAAGSLNLFTLFCLPLLYISLGTGMMIGIRHERDLKV